MPKRSSRRGPDSRGFVFSTNPDFSFDPGQEPETELPAAEKQLLIVRLDRRQRGGKEVTLVEGFRGPLPELEELGRRLRTHCGTGGSVKEGAVLVQGDVRDKVLAYLHKQGYAKAKRGN
jgi:translation initiation factor 1